MSNIARPPSAGFERTVTPAPGDEARSTPAVPCAPAKFLGAPGLRRTESMADNARASLGGMLPSSPAPSQDEPGPACFSSAPPSNFSATARPAFGLSAAEVGMQRSVAQGAKFASQVQLADQKMRAMQVWHAVGEKVVHSAQRHLRAAKTHAGLEHKSKGRSGWVDGTGAMTSRGAELALPDIEVPFSKELFDLSVDVIMPKLATSVLNRRNSEGGGAQAGGKEAGGAAAAAEAAAAAAAAAATAATAGWF
mgnify:CR=1 FL=1